MLGASSVSFWRINLTLRIHKATDEIGILEINFLNSVLAEMAEFFLRYADFVTVAICVHTLG